MLCMCRELYEEGSHQMTRDKPLGVHPGENQGPPMRSAYLLRRDFHALKNQTRIWTRNKKNQNMDQKQENQNMDQKQEKLEYGLETRKTRIWTRNKY